MSFENEINSDLILGTITRHASAHEEEDTQNEIIASYRDDIIGLLLPNFHPKMAADAEDYAVGVKGDKASEYIKLTPREEKGFNKMFFDLLADRLGPDFLSEGDQESGDGASARVIEDRKNAISKFYKTAKTRLFVALSKAYSDRLRTPTEKKVSIRRLVTVPKVNPLSENKDPITGKIIPEMATVEDDTFKRVEVSVPGAEIEESYSFADAFEALKHKAPKGSQSLGDDSEESSKKNEASKYLSGLSPKDFTESSNQRNYSQYIQNNSFEANYKGKKVPARYLIEVRNIGEFLQKADVTFRPGELSDQIKSILADMFLFFEGNFAQDPDGVGTTAFDNSIARTFSGDEKSDVFDSTRQLIGMFAPKIDARRHNQLKNLYFKDDSSVPTIDEEQAARRKEQIEKGNKKNLEKRKKSKSKITEHGDTVKEAYSLVKEASLFMHKSSAGGGDDPDFGFLGDDLLDDNKDIDPATIAVGKPDLLLIDHLRREYPRGIEYKIKDLAMTGGKNKNEGEGKDESGVYKLTISFPELEDDGTLLRGQEYTIDAPAVPGFNLNETYLLEPAREKKSRETAIKYKFKDQSVNRQNAAIDVAKDVGLTGKEISELANRSVDSFINHVVSLPTEDFIKYFGKTVILNNKPMADSSDLGALIRTEEEEAEKKKPANWKGQTEIAEKYHSEFEEEERQKKQDTADFWGGEDHANLVAHVLDQGLETGGKRFIEAVTRNLNDKPTSKTTDFRENRAFIVWALEGIAHKTQGMVDKIISRPTWESFLYRNVKNGQMFKDSPELNELWIGPLNEDGGISRAIDTQVKFSEVILKPMMDIIRAEVLKLIQKRDKYILSFLKIDPVDVENAMERVRTKYDGGVDSNGKKVKGLIQRLDEAIHDKNVPDIKRVLGLKAIPADLEVVLQSIVDSSGGVSSEDSKFIHDILNNTRKEDEKVALRRTLFRNKKTEIDPPFEHKSASESKESFQYIVNSVMRRRGYYNV